MFQDEINPSMTATKKQWSETEEQKKEMFTTVIAQSITETRQKLKSIKNG